MAKRPKDKNVIVPTESYTLRTRVATLEANTAASVDKLAERVASLELLRDALDDVRAEVAANQRAVESLTSALAVFRKDVAEQLATKLDEETARAIAVREVAERSLAPRDVTDIARTAVADSDLTPLVREALEAAGVYDKVEDEARKAAACFVDDNLARMLDAVLADRQAAGSRDAGVINVRFACSNRFNVEITPVEE